jgi:hypothetical protein
MLRSSAAASDLQPLVGAQLPDLSREFFEALTHPITEMLFESANALGIKSFPPLFRRWPERHSAALLIGANAARGRKSRRFLARRTRRSACGRQGRRRRDRLPARVATTPPGATRRPEALLGSQGVASVRHPPHSHLSAGSRGLRWLPLSLASRGRSFRLSCWRAWPGQAGLVELISTGRPYSWLSRPDCGQNAAHNEGGTSLCTIDPIGCCPSWQRFRWRS